MDTDIRYCTKCGKQIGGKSKFCTYCGTQVIDYGNPAQQSQPAPVYQQAPQYQQAPVNQQTPQYGQPAPNTSNTYTTHGIGTAPKVVIPSQYSAGNKKVEKPKRKKKRFLAFLLVAVLLFTAFVKPGFLIKDHGPGEGGSGSGTGTVYGNLPYNDPYSQYEENLKEVDRQSASISEESPSATLCGVTLDAECLDFNGVSLNATVVDMGTGTNSSGEFHQYEITLGNQHEYDDAISLHFPAKDPQNTVITHYDEENRCWDPLVTIEDRENGGVVALTHSFSKYRIEKRDVGDLFIIEDAKTPNAHLRLSNNDAAILEKLADPVFAKTMKMYGKDPESYRLNIPEYQAPGEDQMAIDATNTAVTWYSVLSPLVDVSMGLVDLEKGPLDEALMNPKFAPYTSNYKTALSDAMTDITILTMGLQVCMDSYTYGFNSETTALNAYKNLCTNAGTFYSMHTGYSSPGFTLAFLGVTLFSMTLDYMIASAQEFQVEADSAIFDSYYENVHPFNWHEWYDYFVDMYWASDGDVDAAKRAINKKIDEYSLEFWVTARDTNNPDFIDAVATSRYRNFYDISDEQKAAISDEFKVETRKHFAEKALPQIEKFLMERMSEQLSERCYAIIEPFNRTLYFEIKESVDLTTTEVTQYKGCTLAFGKGNTVIKNDGWTLRVPDDSEADNGWKVDFACTDYAWMCANVPDTLFIYESYDDMVNGRTPLRKVPFDLETSLEKSRTTVIDLSGKKALIDTDVVIMGDALTANYSDQEVIAVWGDEAYDHYLPGGHLKLKETGEMEVNLLSVNDFKKIHYDFYQKEILYDASNVSSRDAINVKGTVTDQYEMTINGHSVMVYRGTIDGNYTITGKDDLVDNDGEFESNFKLYNTDQVYSEPDSYIDYFSRFVICYVPDLDYVLDAKIILFGNYAENSTAYYRGDVYPNSSDEPKNKTIRVYSDHVNGRDGSGEIFEMERILETDEKYISYSSWKK